MEDAVRTVLSQYGMRTASVISSLAALSGLKKNECGSVVKKIVPALWITPSFILQKYPYLASFSLGSSLET